MTMPTLETDSAVILIPANEDAAPTAQGGKGGNYEAVRFNAISVHRNTVREWVKRGLPTNNDRRHRA